LRAGSKMTDEIFNELIQAGGMGLFAAFLAWQHVANTKRNDELVRKFQEQIDKMREEQESRIDVMRGRYDAIITRYQEQKESIHQDVARNLESVKDQVSVALRKLDEGLEQMRSLSVERKLREEIRKSGEQ